MRVREAVGAVVLYWLRKPSFQGNSEPVQPQSSFAPSPTGEIGHSTPPVASEVHCFLLSAWVGKVNLELRKTAILRTGNNKMQSFL